MRRIPVQPDAPDPQAVAAAADILRAGGLVAFPTETVYGVCAEASNPAAVTRLRDLKGRDAAQAFAYLLPDMAAADAMAAPLPPIARRLAARFWPGPVTLVVPGRDAAWVGLRLPDSALARSLAAACGRPVFQTSANHAGAPAALNAAGVVAALGERIDLLLDGGRTPGGRSSTVVRCAPRRYEVLREGAVDAGTIARAAIRSVVAVCTGNLCRSPMAEEALRREVAALLSCAERDLAACGFSFASFGTVAVPGQPATEDAVAAAAEVGLDLRAHRSRAFSIAVVRRAAQVYGLTRGHVDFLAPYFEARPDRLALLDPEGKDIADPYGRSLGFYRKTFARIVEACRTRAQELVDAPD